METLTTSSTSTPRKTTKVIDDLKHRTIDGLERVIERLKEMLLEASRYERTALAFRELSKCGGSEADLVSESPVPAARVDALRRKIRHRQTLVSRIRDDGEFPPTCLDCGGDLTIKRTVSLDTIDPNRCIVCAGIHERLFRRR